LRQRVTRSGEETIGRLAQELLESPMVARALTAAFETRERAARAQEVAMGALNLPSASDLERLTRRIRGVSQRLEALEDGLDRLEDRIDGLAQSSVLDQRLTAIEQTLARIEATMSGSGANAGKPAAARTSGSGANAGKLAAARTNTPDKAASTGKAPRARKT
jgi:TolA-binding protein